MNNKKLTTLLTILIITIFCTNSAFAVFTTGKGRHTFKINTFRPTPTLQLQSFLVGFGIDKQISVNFELSNTTNADEPLNFLAPYYQYMKGTEMESGTGSYENDFFLTGPVLNISVQYIPTHELFVNPNSLNAVEVGIKNLRGDSKNPITKETAEHVNRTYLVAGLISRSRWDKNNIISDLHFIADLPHNSWGIDTELGYEYQISENMRLQISYQYMATTAGAANGVSLGFKTHY